MIIIGDTSPISNFFHIDLLYILKDIYGEIIIPESVKKELLKKHSELPEWIKIIPAQNINKISSYQTFLDSGESEALTLYEELNADLIILDERKARLIAKEKNFNFIGTIGILLKAKEKNLIKKALPYLNSLIKNFNFRINKKLFDEIKMILSNE